MWLLYPQHQTRLKYTGTYILSCISQIPGIIFIDFRPHLSELYMIEGLLFNSPKEFEPAKYIFISLPAFVSYL